MSLHSPKETAPHQPTGLLSQAAAYLKTTQGQVLAGVSALGLALSPNATTPVQAQQPAPMVRTAEWNPSTPENREKVRISKKDLQLVLQVQYKKEWEAYQNARSGNKPENVSEERWAQMKQNEAEMRRRLAEASRNLCKALSQYVSTTPNIGEPAHIAAAEVIAALGADDPEMKLLALDLELKVLPQGKAETDKRVRAIGDAWNGTEPKLSEASALRFALAQNHEADAFYAAGNMSAAYEASNKALRFLPQDSTPSKELVFMQKVLKRTSTLVAVRMENSAKQLQLQEAKAALAKDPLNKAAAKTVYEDHVANKRYEDALRILCALQYFGAGVSADVPAGTASEQIDGGLKWEERQKEQKDPVIRLIVQDAIERHYRAVLVNANASAVLKGLAEKKLGPAAPAATPVTPPKVVETKPVPVRPGTKETDPTKEPKRPSYVPKEAVWLPEMKSWYLLVPRVVDLAEAEKMAAMTKGHLVTANNAAEYALIQKIAAGKPVFLGVRLNEGKWVNADGKADQYFDWQPGEPSNGRGETGIQMLGNGKTNDIHPLDPSCNSNVLIEWEAEKKIVDLLETKFRTLKGEAKLVDKKIVTDHSSPRIEFNLESKKGNSYVIKASIVRKTGNDTVGVTFPVGRSSCVLVLGGWGNAVSGFSNISSHEAVSEKNPTASKQGIRNDIVYDVQIDVKEIREGSYFVEAKIDDAVLARWQANESDFSPQNDYSMNAKGTLMVGTTNGSIEILKLQLDK